MLGPWAWRRGWHYLHLQRRQGSVVPGGAPLGPAAFPGEEWGLGVWPRRCLVPAGEAVLGFGGMLWARGRATAQDMAVLDS